jgi:hypothetical protein
MQLLTKELLRKFEEIGRQDDEKDPIVVCKFFNPTGSGTWYATEYDPESRVFFGYVTGLGFDEWGYFCLDELESIRLRFGLKIERDLYFEPQRISEAVPD